MSAGFDWDLTKACLAGMLAGSALTATALITGGAAKSPEASDCDTYAKMTQRTTHFEDGECYVRFGDTWFARRELEAHMGRRL